MIQPHEMHAAMKFCEEHALSPVLLSAEGKYIVALDPKMPREAVDRAWSYHRTQPRIGIDLPKSECVGITTLLGAGDAAIAELESEFGAMVPNIEQCRFEQDGVTSSARHVRAVRVARWPQTGARPSTKLQERGVAVTVSGYAPLNIAVAIEPLSKKWTWSIEGIPAAQAAREKTAREEDFAWRNGTHPSQQPNSSARRLLEPYKIMHGSALLDLSAGAVIDDPGLLGNLEAAGAIIGGLDPMPRVRNLQPGEVRFHAPFKAAMGYGGWRSYREGDLLAGMSSRDVDELRRAGAVIDFGGDSAAQTPDTPTPPSGGQRKVA
ncbi:MAG: hypothetical protein NVSMB64_00220 [Candidatus Velthaea sp.]